MKAAVLKELGKIEVTEVDRPECVDGSILLKVEAAALCGSDIRTYRSGSKLLRLPQILGHEVAGSVVAVGNGVTGVAIGDRLALVPSNPCGECPICRRGLPPDLCPNHKPIGFYYPGGFAEYMLIPPSGVRVGAFVRIPSRVDSETAALAEPLGCVIHGQDMVNVTEGDQVVVIGAGPIGCMHASVARSRGAAKTILVQRSEARLEIARRLRVADSYICSGAEDPVSRVREETGGQGADVVITAAATGASHELALEIAAPRGRINLFGGLPKDDPHVRFNSNLVHYRELTVNGSAGTGPREMEKALALVGDGRLDVRRFITHTLALDDIQQGIGMVESGVGLKILLKA